MGRVFKSYSWILRLTFYRFSLKILNQADYGRFSDLFSVDLKTTDNSNLKLLMFKWHDKSFGFIKFRISLMSMKMRTQSALLADTCTGITFWARYLLIFLPKGSFCQKAHWNQLNGKISTKGFWLNEIFSLMIFWARIVPAYKGDMLDLKKKMIKAPFKMLTLEGLL